VVSVAAGLRVDAGTIVEARLVAGAVAPMPWRLSASESELIGKPASDATFAAAAHAAASGAQPLAQNGFKVELLRRAVARALQDLAGRHD
jgi:xanthine dehydrogenase YagS FAD-binding subunit